MRLNQKTVNLALVVGTAIVLWLGKALPEAVSKVEGGSVFLAGYVLVAIGWLWLLAVVAEARLFPLFGRWRNNWLYWGIALAPVLFVVSGLGYAASTALGFNPPAEAEMMSAFQGLAILMLVILVGILAVLEEWLFRGVILEFLRPHSVVLAVLGSAAIFAVYHFSFFQLLPTFLLGLGLALMVVYLRAVWPAVVAHALFNVAGVLIVTLGEYTGGMG